MNSAKVAKVEPKKLSPEIYGQLEAIVGPDWISEDRAIVEGYSRGLMVPTEILSKHVKDPTVLPACIILPGTTEEVQAIVRLCNRYEVPITPYTNGQMLATPTTHGTVCIHFARMDRVLEINEKSMTATLQPYVSYNVLQAEAMKKGMWNGGVPLATGICKVSSQFNGGGIWQTDLKYGSLSRNIVSVRMVLPDGDILVTGSAGQPGTENFWEYSPGPDIIGLIRSSLGTMGLVTEITVKLHSWVGGSSFPEDVGHPSIDTYYEDVEEKRFERPPTPERHRIYWLEFPDYDSEIEALYKIAHSGIGIGLNATGAYSLYYCSQTTEMTNQRATEEFFPPWNCYVMLAGISSEKQLEYEEKALKQIAHETKGKFLSEEYKPEVLDALAPWNQDCIRHVTGMRMCRGGWSGFVIPVGRISMAKKHSEMWCKALEELGETHITDRGGCGSTPMIYVVNRGHFMYSETDNYPQTHADPDGLGKVLEYLVYSHTASIKEGIAGIGAAVAAEPFTSFYPEIGPNTNLFLRKVRKVFDPKGIYAPGRRVYTKEEFKKVPPEVSGLIGKHREKFGLPAVKAE